MSFVINIGNAVPPAQPPSLAKRAVPLVDISKTASQDTQSAQDTVELSAMGRRLAQAAEASTYRIARIRAISSEIADGTYETPERLDATVSKLLNLFG